MLPFPLLIALAQAVPSIAKFFGKGEAVANTIGNIATAVAGTATPEEAVAKITASTELQVRFEEEVMKNETHLEEIYLADVQSARERDAKIVQSGQHNYRADTMYVLAVIVIIGITYAIFTDDNVNEFVKGVVTLILGRFLGYLDNIYNFEFGSTRSNRTKDDTINKLSTGD